MFKQYASYCKHRICMRHRRIRGHKRRWRTPKLHLQWPRSRKSIKHNAARGGGAHVSTGVNCLSRLKIKRVYQKTGYGWRVVYLVIVCISAETVSSYNGVTPLQVLAVGTAFLLFPVARVGFTSRNGKNQLSLWMPSRDFIRLSRVML